MTKKTKTVLLITFACILAVLLVASILVPSVKKDETIQEAMSDAVLHERAKVSLFGLEVNPGLISAFVVTGILTVAALLIRIFVIPKFKIIPGKFQAVLEKLVDFFDGVAKGNSPHRYDFLSAYIFVAGVYIFFSTLFEMLGVQAVTTRGTPVSLPEPLSDINGAIAMGGLTYLFILFGGITANKMRGLVNTLKDFSLPISMSFRLFGALLSGLLVSELVYYVQPLSYGLPVLVAVLFTVLDAIIQAYVLITLTSLFYGEVTEPPHKKPRKGKQK